MDQFLMGAIALGWVVAALFFLRFWRQTHDRLFAIFALSFALLELTRIVMACLNTDAEDATFPYWIRLVAYLLILVAIVDKNLSFPRART